MKSQFVNAAIFKVICVRFQTIRIRSKLQKVAAFLLANRPAFGRVDSAEENMTIQAISELNDKFRLSFAGGRVVMTAGVAALPDATRAEVVRAVQTFDAFSADNDPHAEHDFGSFELAGHKFFWKIDYYDESLQFGSDNPADPTVTVRVLTVMLAEEY
jgi:hypothetical protein